MSTVTSNEEAASQRSARRATSLYTAVEILLVYAGILQYIWRWQFSHPRAWVWMLGFVVATHFVHRDRVRNLGLSLSAMRASATIAIPLAVVAYIPLVFYGFAKGILALSAPGKQTAESFVSYLVWCCFQQYLAESYFYHRLQSILRSQHVASVLVGIMFGAAHVPNPILMIATTVGGVIFAEIFARHRNIFPLALAQAVGGLLIGAISPPSLLHHMRVGPGYFFYRPH
jgi:hypothetical protein